MEHELGIEITNFLSCGAHSIFFFVFLYFIIPAKNCTTPVGGSFMSLRDKEIVSQTFLHDTDATFVCNAGYEPAGGSGVIKCTAGKWSPLTLNCKREY